MATQKSRGSTEIDKNSTGFLKWTLATDSKMTIITHLDNFIPGQIVGRYVEGLHVTSVARVWYHSCNCIANMGGWPSE